MKHWRELTLGDLADAGIVFEISTEAILDSRVVRVFGSREIDDLRHSREILISEIELDALVAEGGRAYAITAAIGRVALSLLDAGRRE